MAEVGGDSKTPRIDMTPMVDLGFLLLTFFVLTTNMSRPHAMQMVVPAKEDKKKDVEKEKIPEERVMNILLTGKDRVYWYQGLEEPELNKTNFSDNGIREVIVEKQKATLQNPKLAKFEDRDLIVMIKAADDAKHSNFVDIIDEMKITDQGKYMLLDITATELLMVRDYEEDQGLEISVEEAISNVPKDKLAAAEAS
jgi:biopolymer transport protein ExbD